MSKTKTLKSFSVTTLIKLAALVADSDHGGAFAVIADSGEFRAAFGAPSTQSQAESLPAHDSLKSALVALLVDNPTFGVGDVAKAAGREA